MKREAESERTWKVVESIVGLELISVDVVTLNEKESNIYTTVTRLKSANTRSFS